MSKYQLFLEQIEVIPEDLFMDVINSFPEFNIEEVDFDEYDSQDGIARSIFDYLLSEWSYAFVDYIDFESKKFELMDVDNLEDLEEIREKFPKWSIVNYDDIKNTLEEDKKEREKEREKENEFSKKMTLLTKLAKEISLEQVENIVSNYDNKG